MTNNPMTVPILMYTLLIVVSVLNLWFPAILSALLLVVGGVLLFAVYRLNKE